MEVLPFGASLAKHVFKAVSVHREAGSDSQVWANENDWRGSLLCSIFFLINIQQFRHLVGKGQSLINGSLQQLGYLVQGQACLPAGV